MVKNLCRAFALTLGATAGAGLTTQTANASAAYRTIQTKTYYGNVYHAISKLNPFTCGIVPTLRSCII